MKVSSSLNIKRSSQVIGVAKDSLFIYGGELEPRRPVDDKVYTVDLKGNGEVQTLETLQNDDAPIPRVGSAGTVVGDTLYIFSGRGGPSMKPLDEDGALWSLPLTLNDPIWKLVKSNSPISTTGNTSGDRVPAPRSYHAMTSDGASSIYLHAGCPTSGRLSDLWKFDIKSGVWTQLADAPDPSRGGTSITYTNGKLYRMNGFDGNNEQGGAIDVYDVQRDSWATIKFKPDNTEGPEARSVSCLAPIKIGDRLSLVTLAGERDPSSLGHEGAGKMLGDAWAWDVQDETWSKVEIDGESPLPRGWFAADVARVSGSDGLIIHGGLGEDNERLDDVWLLSF